MHLYYFNKTEDDIWCRDVLEDLSKKDQRFKVKHILSEPNKNWNGETGRISEKFIAEIMNLAFFALVCGNIGFNMEALRILRVSNIETFCFEG